MMESTDQTVPLATELGATVIPHSLNGDWKAPTTTLCISQSFTVNGLYALLIPTSVDHPELAKSIP